VEAPASLTAEAGSPPPSKVGSSHKKQKSEAVTVPFKKRGLLVVGLTLFLFMVAGSTPFYSPNILFLSPPLTNPSPQITNKLQGNGGSLDVLLQVVNNTNTTSIITNTTTDFSLECPAGWNLTHTHINLTNINAPNHTMIVESDPRQTYLSLDHETAMSFTLPNNAYLDAVNMLLQVPDNPNVLFMVKNSTPDGKPGETLGLNLTQLAPTGGTYQWFNITFNHVPLLLNNTSNNKFYISASYSGLQIPYWGAVEDGSVGDNDDEGDVYQYIATWVKQSMDMKMELYLSASNTSPYTSPLPSEINLRINGSSVEDTRKGEGYWTLPAPTPESSGSVFFNVTSTWMETVTLTVDWRNKTYGKTNTSTTNYRVLSGSPAEWNITFEARFAQGSTGSYNLVEIQLPSDWENSTPSALKTGGGSQPYQDNQPHFVRFRASNGTWTVQCTAPNYVTDIKVKLQGFPNKELSRAIPTDVLLVNASYYGAVTGSSNLSVYQNSNLNYTTSNDTVSGYCVFTWNTSASSSDVGQYNITVSFQSQFEAGYLSKGFPLVDDLESSLVWLEAPPLQSENGSIRLRVQFNRSDVNAGVKNAVFRILDNGVELPASKVSVVDHLNGTYDISFTLTDGEHDINVVARGDHTAEVNLSFRVAVGQPAAGTVLSSSFLLLAFLVGVKSEQQSILLLAVVGVVAVAGGTGGYTAYRRRMIPRRVLSRLENIIVDHIETGVTLWFYDFLTLGQDVALFSGFISAVKSFMGEMQRGGLKRLGTELGTLIREEGKSIAASFIVGTVGSAEEKWLRERVARFVELVEREMAQELADWRGNVAPFKEKLPVILESVIDLELARRLQADRVPELRKKKVQLRERLNDLGSRLEENWNLLQSNRITPEQYDRIRRKLEPEYEQVQKEFIHVNLLLQRIPPDLAKLTDRKAKELEKVKNRFYRIQREVNELSRKKEYSKRDVKRKEKLTEELMKLIEKLDEFTQIMSQN